jgi:anti-sigma factor ChrR (cupin superfamily)
LPGAAWAELGPRRPLEWRSLLARGIQWASVASDPSNGAALVAVRAARRSVLPAHEHTRVELGVILEGGYADHAGDYDLGDFFTYETGTSHRPRMDAQEGCIALIRLEAPNRFLGWRGWFFR